MAALVMRERVSLRPAADPNVIPFIDVLLVLLIIFMVTAPKPTADLRVDLPTPGPSLAAAIPPTRIELRAAPEGVRFYVGGEEAPLAELGTRALTHMLELEPALTQADAFAEGRVYVRADLDVTYQHVVAAVEALQTTGFRKVAILAQDATAS